MSLSKLPSNLEDMKVNLRIKLSTLWASLMFCYIYGDYIGLYEPGKLDSMIAGQMVPLGSATQNVLLGVSAMMAIPGLMVFLTIVLNATASRWANIIFGALYTVIMLATMPGAWIYIYLSRLVRNRTYFANRLVRLELAKN